MDRASGRLGSSGEATWTARVVALDGRVRRHGPRKWSPWIVLSGDTPGRVGRHNGAAGATCLAIPSDRIKGGRRSGRPSLSPTFVEVGDRGQRPCHLVQARRATSIAQAVASYRREFYPTDPSAYRIRAQACITMPAATVTGKEWFTP